MNEGSNITMVMLLVAVVILVALYYNEFREKFQQNKTPSKDFIKDVGDYQGPTVAGDLTALSGTFGEDISADSGVFDKDVSAETGKFRRIRVNRSDKEKWPRGWGPGVHSWDIYANATIATGKGGNLNNVISGHTGRMWTAGGIDMKGGVSAENPNGWWSHFPWAGDGKNYIRGDTEIRGATQQLGDLHVHKKVQFHDSPNYHGGNDPYHIQKITKGPDSSTLRLTINDDRDEALEIWGNSCALGNCRGPGAMGHRFTATGDVVHTGNVKVGSVQLGDKFRLSGVGDAHGNDDWLRLFNADGTAGYYGGLATGKSWNAGWGYNGGDFVNGGSIYSGDNLVLGNNAGNKWILHAPNDSRRTLYIAPWKGADWSWGDQIRIESNGTLCTKKQCY